MDSFSPRNACNLAGGTKKGVSMKKEILKELLGMAGQNGSMNDSIKALALIIILSWGDS